jgi:hypothetical protein
MVAQGFEKRSFIAPVRRELDKGLHKSLEELVPAQTVVVQVLVHLVDVAHLPKVHQAMDAVNERHGLARRGLVQAEVVAMEESGGASQNEG